MKELGQIAALPVKHSQLYIVAILGWIVAIVE
jgi:hypothetical protein